MYEDILDDPEVQAMVEKYEGTHQNDVPLDDFGKPLQDDSDDDSDDDTKDKPDGEDDDTPEEGKKNKDDTAEEDAKINESSLEEFVEKVPEIDYTPQTEFSKSLDLTKIDDGFQKY